MTHLYSLLFITLRLPARLTSSTFQPFTTYITTPNRIPHILSAIYSQVILYRHSKLPISNHLSIFLPAPSRTTTTTHTRPSSSPIPPTSHTVPSSVSTTMRPSSPSSFTSPPSSSSAEPEETMQIFVKLLSGESKPSPLPPSLSPPPLTHH